MMNTRPAARDAGAIALAADTLASFGRLRLRLGGTSMLPALRPGDVVEFHALASCEARPGELVLFRRGGNLVVHRVLGCGEQGLVTQGDALDSPDPLVAHAHVLGRAVALTRGGREIAFGNFRGLRWRVARWWFRRFDLASRLWLRWHRLAVRPAA
jgi:hypothetical protein